ncbi:cupin domain-containing protein [Nocardia sp. BMG111209]|uniref:cupin domain-containing protein n=1 Tax=Nocardia sp. BMG111209 TaxID=1160137 RepID=UPI000380441A|nr:cupin domain-containing protein [Nocardia sp. BMG111209]
MTGLAFQRRADAAVRQEHGCEVRRILPWGHTGPSDTGMGVCAVAPGTVSTPHRHVDHEQFYVVRGHGRVHVDDESLEIGPGDAFVVGSRQLHFFENCSATDILELISVWSQGPLGGAS